MIFLVSLLTIDIPSQDKSCGCAHHAWRGAVLTFGHKGKCEIETTSRHYGKKARFESASSDSAGSILPETVKKSILKGELLDAFFGEGKHADTATRPSDQSQHKQVSDHSRRDTEILDALEQGQMNGAAPSAVARCPVNLKGPQ